MKITCKRLLSFIMALCILVSLTPLTALASDDTVNVSGEELYSQAYAVLDIVNTERANAGLPALTMTQSLMDTAMLRSAEQAIYYSHTRPNGNSCFTAFSPEDGGYRGENIAVNYANATRVMTAWMNSDGHRANILNTKFNAIGIGCFEHNGIKYWTQCFSSATTAAASKPADTTVSAEISLGDKPYDFALAGGSSMEAGTTQTLTVMLVNPGFNYANTYPDLSSLTWNSSAPAIASVENGVVTAHAAGTAEISANAGVTELKLSVTVTGGPVHTHSMVHVERKEPTIKEYGYEEHWICTGCSTIFADAEGTVEVTMDDLRLDMLECTDHQWNSGVITTVPTTSSTGIKTYTCILCDATKTEVIPADSSVTMMRSGSLSIAKPTQQQLSDQWSAITSASDFFAEQPSVAAPYASGVLTDSFINSGVTYLNFLRAAANLPAIQADDSLNTEAQYGAVLLAAVDTLTHYPSQPADMDSDFYSRGKAATSSSNISMRYGYENYNPIQSSLQGCINDSGANNLATLGHRRWLLNPTLLNVGFGYAKSTAGKDYIATKVFDRSGPAMDYDFVSWPASGNFPNNVFGSDVPWSITLNPNKYKKPVLENVTVTLTRVSDNKVWTFNAATGEPSTSAYPYMTVNNSGYGVNNCIIFSPGSDNISSYEGSFIVKAVGLQYADGTEAELNYQVDFFAIAECIHVPAVIPAVAPTCEEAGKTEGSMCSECGMILVQQEPVPATGHTEVTVTGTAPSCTEDGLTDGTRCETCGKTITEQEIIPATGHDYLMGVCTVCGGADPDATPIPIETPVLTTTPEITPEPIVTPTPEVTPLPIYTPIPTVKPTPEVTPEPIVTPTPVVTPEPIVTPTPVVTPEPIVTPTPVVTPEPIVTPTPVVTPEPIVTPTPVVTPEPIVTPTPVVTPEPTVTPTPEVTPEPIVTPTPVVTPEPIVTPTPVVTPEPIVTPTPVVTPEPTPVVKPTPTPTPPPQGNPFIDITPQDYFYEPVLWAVGQGITGGIGGGQFGPELPCTRGQVVMFLWRAAGSPAPTMTFNPFDDVSPTDYYYDAVLWAVEKGITGGIGFRAFGPDQPCTRGQIVMFLWRAEDSPTSSFPINPFIDVMETDYYYNAVLWAVENRITGGTGPGTFSPNATCTRGQIATFLYKNYQ